MNRLVQIYKSLKYYPDFAKKPHCICFELPISSILTIDPVKAAVLVMKIVEGFAAGYP